MAQRNDMRTYRDQPLGAERPADGPMMGPDGMAPERPTLAPVPVQAKAAPTKWTGRDANAPKGAVATPNAPLTTNVPAGPPAGQPTGVGLTPTDPNNPLTGQTIARNPLVDRFTLAQERFNTFTQATDPQYQAALRQAQRMGAASGGLGSGMLRTDLGNLAGQRDLQMRTAQQGFLQDALEGTIGDQFRDIGIAQQQQGFQNQQQQQAFENELRRLGFSEDMLNSAFGRALQTYMAGQTGGTGAQTGIQVGQNRFAQGQSALDALNELLGWQARGTPQVPATPPIAGQTYPWMGGTGA